MATKKSDSTTKVSSAYAHTRPRADSPIPISTDTVPRKDPPFGTVLNARQALAERLADLEQRIASLESTLSPVLRTNDTDQDAKLAYPYSFTSGHCNLAGNLYEDTRFVSSMVSRVDDLLALIALSE